MSNEPKSKNTTTVLATVGLILLPVLCCGLPLLIAAGAFSALGVLGALGAVFGNPWVIAVAVVLVAGLLLWVLRRRRATAAAEGDACCTPPRPLRVTSQGNGKPGVDA